jgi:hypothetical protein
MSFHCNVPLSVIFLICKSVFLPTCCLALNPYQFYHFCGLQKFALAVLSVNSLKTEKDWMYLQCVCQKHKAACIRRDQLTAHRTKAQAEQKLHPALLRMQGRQCHCRFWRGKTDLIFSINLPTWAKVLTTEIGFVITKPYSANRI